jgi:hypothetical protein
MLSFLDVLSCGMAAMLLLFLASTITRYDVPAGTAKRGIIIEWNVESMPGGPSAAKTLLVPYLVRGETKPVAPVYPGKGQSCSAFCRTAIDGGWVSVLGSSFAENLITASTGEGAGDVNKSTLLLHIEPESTGCWRIGIMFWNRTDNQFVGIDDKLKISARIWTSDLRELMPYFKSGEISPGRLLPAGALVAPAVPKGKSDFENGIVCVK